VSFSRTQFHRDSYLEEVSESGNGNMIMNHVEEKEQKMAQK
jgi:hypothetical protein